MSSTIELTPQLRAALVKLRDANIDLVASLSLDDITRVDFGLNQRSAEAREAAILELCCFLAPPEHRKFYAPTKPSLRAMDDAETAS